MVGVPEAVGVKVAEQLELEESTAESAQGLPEYVPVPPEKVTEPVGADAVPAFVSVTVAVQVVD